MSNREEEQTFEQTEILDENSEISASDHTHDTMRLSKPERSFNIDNSESRFNSPL